MDFRQHCRPARGAAQTYPDSLLTAAVAVGAYLLGSVPTGVLLGRRAGVDVRTVGSGNIGAANVTRTLGWRAGVIALAGDVCKGLLPVLVARGLAIGMAGECATALAAVAGHMFPLFSGFRGGKGVATALGVFLVLAPLAAALALGAFAIAALSTRIASVASLAGVAAVAAAIWTLDYPPMLGITGVLVAAAVFWRHRDNLARLRLGQEPRFR